MSKVLIAVPCMDMVDTLFMASLLALDKPDGTEISIESGSLVYISRNKLLYKAITDDFTHILFIDSDMVFNRDALVKLLSHDKDCVSGLFFRRTFPIKPTILKHNPYYKGEQEYFDYPKNRLFEIQGSGLAFTLIKVNVCKALMDKYKCSPFEPMPGLGEDYSFCERMINAGYKMYCDSSVKIGHIGQLVFNEKLYEQSHIRKEADDGK